MKKKIVEFKNINKSYKDVVAVNNFNLEIYEGEFLTLLGPSGCGKTTSLRILAGFEKPSKGAIYLDEDQINEIPSYQRPINMVFQNYALFPHMNIFDNVAYGLRQKKISEEDIKVEVTKFLSLVRLEGYESRNIWQLSGGQQQRVALARALINKPKILLLDEPLAALDKKLRKEMQIELQNLQKNLNITFILVTHDQEEALSMSDRICVMNKGNIIQIGSPNDLYDFPANKFVANFIGKSNFINCEIKSISEKTIEVSFDEKIFSLKNDSTTFAKNEKVLMSFRPEKLKINNNTNKTNGLKINSKVLNKIFLGEYTEYYLSNEKIGDFYFLNTNSREEDKIINPGSVIDLWIDEKDIILLKNN
jgi:spermidine/putrescine transport system ATP-binding protein